MDNLFTSSIVLTLNNPLIVFDIYSELNFATTGLPKWPAFFHWQLTFHFGHQAGLRLRYLNFFSFLIFILISWVEWMLHTKLYKINVLFVFTYMYMYVGFETVCFLWNIQVILFQLDVSVVFLVSHNKSKYMYVNCEVTTFECLLLSECYYFCDFVNNHHGM